MPPSKIVSDEELQKILGELQAAHPSSIIRAWQIKDELLKQTGEIMDESTIRGRFIAMNKPLGGSVVPKEEIEAPRAIVAPVEANLGAVASVDIPDELKAYIPTDADVAGYLERDVDVRLNLHYACSKHPITQGPQGTGKTFSHMYYAWKHKLPFMLISCFPDMVLHKFFGDKTLKDGSIVFREGSLVKMCQVPSVILFDEINAIENSKSYDFHALLQNRELFVKDGNDGEGKIYKLHKDCKIGFAQNPRSAKYIGGTVKPSSFLGRCSYITFPNFSKAEVSKILKSKYPKLDKQKVLEFTDFFFETNNYLHQNGISVDVSIRQLQTCVEFFLSGMSLPDALDDGMISVLDSVSSPQSVAGLRQVSKTIFQDLNEKAKQDDEKLSELKEKLAKSIAGQVKKQAQAPKTP